MTIKESILKMTQGDDEIYSQIATVTAIDEAERTCTVEPVNGDADIHDVRLQAVISGATGLLLVPKKGSDVIVTFLGKETAHVTSYSDVEKVMIDVNNQSFKFDENGLSLKSSQSDLKTEMNNIIGCMDKLIDILTKFQLTTNVGATIAVMPNIIVELQEQKANLAGYKQKINTFLQ